MARSTTYQTKQMKELRDYLAATAGKHATVRDICRHFDQIGHPLGTATVYRNLEKLIDEGLVTRYTAGPSGSACFEYTGGKENCCRPLCYHLKCQRCGRLIHLECEEMEKLSAHVLADHDFELDWTRTVFYGLCGDCRKAAAR